MEVVFARKEAISDTYMIFGGMVTDRADSTSKITLVGLGMEDARQIYEEFPDFHTCKSQGASAAQRATRQMDIVPANGEVYAALKQAFAEHNASLGSGGDRVCVKMRGAILTWKSAKVQGEEILDQLPAPVRRDHVLVESAEVVPTSLALTGP